MTSAMGQLRAWALCLAEHGWRVFPLRAGTKRGHVLHGRKSCPRTGICTREHQGWEQRATTNPGQVQACWSTGPFNIGVAPGPSGLLIVDCDQPKHGYTWPTGWNRRGVACGEDVLAALAEHAGTTVPATYTVATPSGGKHFYFRAPHPGFRNTWGDHGGIGPLIDTRANGGYVVGPGSITPDGAYELLDDTEPADLPGWLAHTLAPKPSQAISAPHESAPACPSRYVAAALRAETERLAATGTGPQNYALYTAALALGRLVAGEAVDDATVRTRLHHAMSRLPLTRPDDPWTPGQIDATIDSAFRAAARNPRRLDHRGGEAA